MSVKRFDPRVIPYMAAVTTAVMLMRAAVDHFGAWGWVIGPLAGMVASFSLTTAGSRISDIATKRKILAYVSLGLMVAISPIVIALSDPTPDAATWAWAMFPDAAILLASVVQGKSMVAQDAPPVAATSTQVAGKKGGKKPQVARKTVKEGDLVAYLQANKEASQEQVATHFGVSRQAIGSRVKKLYEKGILK